MARPFTIAIASGKGGTGKTTVAVNLASVQRQPVQLMDCDVEEPNCHLFLDGAMRSQEAVEIPVPEVDESLCDGCGECSRLCQYHAIVSLKTKPLLFPELCHGCGGCAKVCPPRAIREVGRRIGVIETSVSNHISLIQGRLDVGVPIAPPLIRAVKARRRSGMHVILDAPPGTSCPVITTVRDSDVVVLVTEPTPFGLHDLVLAVQLMRELRIPFGVVVNRVGSGDGRVHAFCQAEGIQVLLELPEDRRVAEAYSRGELLSDVLPEYRLLFVRLLETILDCCNQTEGATHAHV
ncbi:MAG: ATP-binding protein [Acidobacteriota bacterium]